MLTKPHKCLMNEADGSGGNGAPSPPPPAPAAPTAAPTAPEPPATPDVSAIVDAKLKAFQNEFFANARKAGLLKKDEPPAPASSAVAPAPTALSMADVEAMLERERVVTRVATEHKLSDAQVKRMKGLLAAEKPEDVSAWVSSFVTDMGFVRPTETATQATAVAVQPSAAPISDRGTPVPSGATGWKYEIASNPMSMSKAAIAAMNAELGEDKARRQRLDAARSQAERLQVVINPRG